MLLGMSQTSKLLFAKRNGIKAPKPYCQTTERGWTIDSTYRIDYLASHIARMQEAVEEGCEIIGYLTWSATDLYSTREGFEKRYGFVDVDKDNSYKRLKKKSFYWYKKVIETNGNDLSY